MFRESPSKGGKRGGRGRGKNATAGSSKNATRLTEKPGKVKGTPREDETFYDADSFTRPVPSDEDAVKNAQQKQLFNDDTEREDAVGAAKEKTSVDKKEAEIEDDEFDEFVEAIPSTHSIDIRGKTREELVEIIQANIKIPSKVNFALSATLIKFQRASEELLFIRERPTAHLDEAPIRARLEELRSQNCK